MPATQPLFTIPIPIPGPAATPSSNTTPSTSTPGNFTCTQPAPAVYLLSFAHPPDNRLVPGFCRTFLLALDVIEQRYARGVVMTTSSIAKFYSNGLDYESAIRDPDFFRAYIHPLWRRLVTYPMPTVALLNGHAFAGGLMTAMMHDYRIMNPHKGFLCLNELEFGAPLTPAMTAIFRSKLSMTTVRNMTLESRRYPALEALREGLIDGVGGLDEALAFITELRLTHKAQGKSYGPIKEELYREVIQDMDQADDQLAPGLAARDVDRRRRDGESKARVEQYQALVDKAKL